MNPLQKRAEALGLHGLLANWDQVIGADWLPWLLDTEESERQLRSLERRKRAAKLGAFKTMTDFDYKWPKSMDRPLIRRLLQLSFLEEHLNVVLIGPNGVGKTMIAKQLCYNALLAGHTVRFVTTSAMLNHLAATDSPSILRRRLASYTSPALLCIDEVGYLSYANEQADLLFEVVTRRYELQRPIIVTTNKTFQQWGTVFPGAACVVTLIDRLVHRCELAHIEAESYRLKEHKERRNKRKSLSSPKTQPSSNNNS